MGTVYEALVKSKMEQARSGAAVEKQVDGLEPQSTTGGNADEFDFMRYSLETPTAVELERMHAEMAAAARARREHTEPARAVAVNVSGIDPHLVAFYDCDPPAHDQFNKLAASIIAAAATQDLKRLLVASARHGEGRTTVALNLACALAHARKRVLLVDTDMKRPSVLRLLGVETEVGIAEALARNLPPGEAAIRILPHGFAVLPARERFESPAELLAGSSFREMLEAFEPGYDFMLFDSSPLLDSNDVSLLLRLTTKALLVVRSGRTTSSHLGKAIGPLTAENIFGVVLNGTA